MASSLFNEIKDRKRYEMSELGGFVFELFNAEENFTQEVEEKKKLVEHRD